MLLRARVFALIAAFALAAGPLAAACADCCPSPDGPLALAPAEGCCGDCAPTLDRSPERPSAALRAASPEISASAVAIPLAAAPRPAPILAGTLADVRSAHSPPARAFAPLRL